MIWNRKLLSSYENLADFLYEHICEKTGVFWSGEKSAFALLCSLQETVAIYRYLLFDLK